MAMIPRRDSTTGQASVISSARLVRTALGRPPPEAAAWASGRAMDHRIAKRRRKLAPPPGRGKGKFRRQMKWSPGVARLHLRCIFLANRRTDMAGIIAERMCAEVEGDFVVFLIGMRINKPWKVWSWWPGAAAM